MENLDRKGLRRADCGRSAPAVVDDTGRARSVRPGDPELGLRASDAGMAVFPTVRWGARSALPRWQGQHRSSAIRASRVPTGLSRPRLFDGHKVRGPERDSRLTRAC